MAAISEGYIARELRRGLLEQMARQYAGEHVMDGTCWCQPVLDYEDPVTGGRVYVHRQFMDGPAYEPVEPEDGA